MPRLYKGVGVGSFLHNEHVRKGIRNVGLSPHLPGMRFSLPALVQHICGNTVGPHVSLTRSFGVAWNYAIDFSHLPPTSAQPAFVFAIDLEYTDLRPLGINVIDPMAEIAKYVNDPLAPNSYHHNGEMDFLLGLVNPTTMGHFATKAARQPQSPQNTNQNPAPTNQSLAPAHASLELKAMVHALRDAEIIVCGTIPGRFISDVHPVY